MVDTFVADKFVVDMFVADNFVADSFVADNFVANMFVANTSVADKSGPTCLGRLTSGRPPYVDRSSISQPACSGGTKVKQTSLFRRSQAYQDQSRSRFGPPSRHYS